MRTSRVIHITHTQRSYFPAHLIGAACVSRHCAHVFGDAGYHWNARYQGLQSWKTTELQHKDEGWGAASLAAPTFIKKKLRRGGSWKKLLLSDVHAQATRGLPVCKRQYSRLFFCFCFFILEKKRRAEKEKEGHRQRTQRGGAGAHREEWTAVNFDSWPPSRGSRILMVVLRAEREEGWLILCYVTPPTLNCWARAAWLEMGQVWIQMCVRGCVWADLRCERETERERAKKELWWTQQLRLWLPFQGKLCVKLQLLLEKSSSTQLSASKSSRWGITTLGFYDLQAFQSTWTSLEHKKKLNKQIKWINKKECVHNLFTENI